MVRTCYCKRSNLVQRHVVPTWSPATQSRSDRTKVLCMSAQLYLDARNVADQFYNDNIGGPVTRRMPWLRRNLTAQKKTCPMSGPDPQRFSWIFFFSCVQTTVAAMVSNKMETDETLITRLLGAMLSTLQSTSFAGLLVIIFFALAKAITTEKTQRHSANSLADDDACCGVRFLRSHQISSILPLRALRGRQPTGWSTFE